MYIRYDYEDGSYSIHVIAGNNTVGMFAESSPMLITEVSEDDYRNYMNWKYPCL